MPYNLVSDEKNFLPYGEFTGDIVDLDGSLIRIVNQTYDTIILVDWDDITANYSIIKNKPVLFRFTSKLDVSIENSPGQYPNTDSDLHFAIEFSNESTMIFRMYVDSMLSNYSASGMTGTKCGMTSISSYYPYTVLSMNRISSLKSWYGYSLNLYRFDNISGANVMSANINSSNPTNINYLNIYLEYIDDVIS